MKEIDCSTSADQFLVFSYRRTVNVRYSPRIMFVKVGFMVRLVIRRILTQTISSVIKCWDVENL